MSSSASDLSWNGPTLNTTDPLTGPRGTKVGMTETQITEKFRDMGQKANQTGSRSLYVDNSQKCYGNITAPETDRERAQRLYEEKSGSMTEEQKRKEEARIKTLDNEKKRNWDIVYWYVDKQYEATISIWYYMRDGVCQEITNRFRIN